MKQDEDEWTKGSFRQMKDEGTIPKGRPAAKEKWDRRSVKGMRRGARWPYRVPAFFRP